MAETRAEEARRPQAAEGPGPAPSTAYAIVFPIAKALIGRLMFRMRWLGYENVPQDGPALLVANHVSYIDPFAVGLSLPTRRPIHYMAKTELFRVPVLGPFLQAAGMIPVKRGKPDRAAIRATASILTEGGVVGVFPEGTRVREGKTSEAASGTSFLASMTGAPIVPAGISGTDRIWPAGRRLPRFPKVTVVFGEPIDPAAFADLPKSERLQAMTEAVTAGINAAKAKADAAGRETR